MARSYRAQVCAAIAAVLPTADLRCVDRRGRDRWGFYPLAFVWLFSALSRGATLAERFADARGWLRGLAPRLRLAGTYRGFAQALRRRGDVLALWLTAVFQERLAGRLGDADLVAGRRPPPSTCGRSGTAAAAGRWPCGWWSPGRASVGSTW